MADEVIIGNVGGTNGVASEATLQALVRAIEKMGARSGQTGRGAKVQDLHNKALEKGTTATEDQTKSVEDNTDAVKDSTEAAKDFSKTLGDLAGFGIGQVLASLSGMTKSLLEGETSLEAYASQIPFVGSLLGAMAGYIDRSMEAFRDMSAVGAGFNNDMLAMRRIAAQNNLTLEEFSSIVTNNSKALAVLGGSVTGGIQRFTAMNRALKETGTFEELQNMGFSIVEINEGLADYAALQSRMGRLQGKSTQELAAGSAEYLKQLDMLAKLTGRSRKEQADALARQAADAGIRTLASQFKEGSKELENFTSNVALIDTLGPTMQTALKDMMDGAVQTEEAGRLVAMAGPQIVDVMKKVGQGGSMEEMLAGFRQAGGALEEFAGGTAAQRVALIQDLRRTDPVMANLLDEANRMLELSNQNVDAVRKEIGTPGDDVKDKVTAFNNAIRSMQESIQVAFIDSGLIELFAEGVKQFAELITGAAGSIKEFTQTMKDKGFLSALAGLVGDALVGLFTNGTVIAALAGGITALFLGKAVLSAMSSAMSGMATNLVGKVIGGRGAAGGAAEALGGAASKAKPAQAGKGFGQAIANISKGIGTGIGAVLKGLATGLKAFANPQILVGAGILGASITAIGAGIAGAAWILGKLLPTFIEGIKGFNDIDGGNLLKVAGGIAAVGASMAALGVGSAVGAAAGALGSLVEGVAGLMGADSPMKKLQDFSNLQLGPNLERNAEAVSIFAQAMQTFPTSMPGEGVFASFGTSIVGFLGNTPFDQLTAFSNLELNLDKIKTNAEAMTIFGQALGSFPSNMPGEGVFESFGTAIAGLLDNTPFDQLVSFGNLDINVEKVKANAEALSAFGSAMRTLPEDMPGAGAFESFGNAIAGLFDNTPFDQIVAFGNLEVNVDRVKLNAEAMKAMASGFEAFAGSNFSSINFDSELVDGLIKFSEIGPELQVTADALKDIAAIEGLDTKLTSLTDLSNIDVSGIQSFNKAILDLADAVAKLNEELAKDNDGGFFGIGGDDKANAGELLKNISLNTNAGAGNTDQLNSTMVKVLEILRQMKDLNDKIEKNTKQIGGSDISGRGITRY